MSDIDERLDEIFYDYDTKFRAGDFAAVDSTLAATDPKPMNLTLALGMVSAAFPARDHLPNYVPFRERCRACFGERADRLLEGL